MKTAKQNGAIAVSGMLFAFLFIVMSTKLFVEILNYNSYIKIRALVDQAAKSGAAIIASEGETAAIDMASNILANYTNKDVSVLPCSPYNCLKIDITFDLASNKTSTYSVTAANYLQNTGVPVIGSFLLP